MVESPALLLVESGRRIGTCKIFRQEVAAEVQAGSFREYVLNLPGTASRSLQHIFEIETLKQVLSPVALTWGRLFGASAGPKSCKAHGNF
jgi:hypothetical protein